MNELEHFEFLCSMGILPMTSIHMGKMPITSIHMGETPITSIHMGETPITSIHMGKTPMLRRKKLKLFLGHETNSVILGARTTQKSPITSPPARVPKDRHVIMGIEFVTNRTEPSIKRAFTPLL
jgi:hypothetical protein